MKLTLSLKKVWFDMISSGIKTEEYREIKSYWERRFIPTKQYDTVEFTLGYPPKDAFSKRMTFEIESITKGKGNTDWGAPSDKEVFIIKLGKRL